jgi:hypothetical protein
VSDINEFLLNKLDKLDGKLDTIREEQLVSKAAFGSHEDRDQEMHDDVKSMGTELKNQSKLLGDYNQSLKEHMRRTELLENKVEPMFTEFQDKQALEKIKQAKRKKILKIAGVISVIVGIAAGIAQVLALFH